MMSLEENKNLVRRAIGALNERNLDALDEVYASDSAHARSLKIKPLIVVLIAGILLASSTSMPVVNAQPILTSLTIAVTSPLLRIPFSSECTIEATLTDESGNPLPNMDIHFVYVCDDHTHPVGTDTNPLATGTVKTDSHGVASLTHTFVYNPYYDPWRISANFSGTTRYAPSSSEYVDIIVIDYTPYLVGGGLIAVAIIGVVGYIVFRRRKKAITMPKTVKARAILFYSLLSCCIIV